MKSPSPIAAGVRLIFRRPSIPLAEAVWRWSLAATAWFLGGIFLIEYFGSLPVNGLDRFLLRTGQPILVVRAIRRIFEGSAVRFTISATLLAIGLIIAWIVLASVGRAAIVRVAAHELGVTVASKRRTIVPLLILNFLRAGVTLAAIVGIIGSALGASLFWASTHAPIAQAGCLLGLFWLLVYVAWLVLNWFLSLASILAAMENGATSALDSTMRLMVERSGAIFSIGIAFGIAHLAAWVGFCGIAVGVFGLLGVMPPQSVFAVEILIALGYFALADVIYTGRIAAYISLLREDELPVKAETSPISFHGGPIDQTELILSDLPSPTI